MHPLPAGVRRNARRPPYVVLSPPAGAASRAPQADVRVVRSPSRVRRPATAVLRRPLPPPRSGSPMAALAPIARGSRRDAGARIAAWEPAEPTGDPYADLRLELQ